MGGTDCICLDKIGTLTENKIKLTTQHIINFKIIYEIN